MQLQYLLKTVSTQPCKESEKNAKQQQYMHSYIACTVLMAWEVGKPGRNEEHKIMCYYTAIGISLYLKFDSSKRLYQMVISLHA